MAVPFILYDNLMDDSGVTLTASSTETGYDVNNLKDRLLYTYWKSTGGATEWVKLDFGGTTTRYADTIAIAGHNLQTVTSEWTVQYSDDDLSYSPASTSYYPQHTHIPADGITLVRSLPPSFTTGASSGHRYWKITFAFCDAAVQVATILLGRRLDFTEYMDVGFDPDALTLQNRVNRSRGGTFVGQVVDHVQQRVKLKVGQAGFATSFLDSTSTTVPSWNDFVRNCWSKGRPFVFQWTGDQPDLVSSRWRHGWYAVPAAGNKIGAPYLSSARRSWTFEMDVLAEKFGVT